MAGYKNFHYMKLVGRAEEIALLNSLLVKDEPEFVAVYGRRRNGAGNAN